MKQLKSWSGTERQFWKHYIKQLRLRCQPNKDRPVDDPSSGELHDPSPKRRQTPPQKETTKSQTTTAIPNRRRATFYGGPNQRSSPPPPGNRRGSALTKMYEDEQRKRKFRQSLALFQGFSGQGFGAYAVPPHSKECGIRPTANQQE
jgi:hypothetical protein